jgi:hypothetical protein
MTDLSSTALVLADRFGQANDMVSKTSEYYTQFTSTISAGALKKWTKDITTAESRRLKDPRAMDIMRAHQPEDHTEPADPGNNLNRPTASKAGTEWVDLALSIEEKQYVIAIG